MAVTGSYLQSQIGGFIMEPVVVFREYIFSDVLPAFGNIEARADQMANDYYNRIGSQPAGEDCDIDMGSVAEDAQDYGVNWYQMMISLRQTMLNLLAAGLFHLVEQQLASISRDASFWAMPLKDTKLAVVAEWYSKYLRLNLMTLSSWPIIDELRLVANSVKHGEGSSMQQLRDLRPELFTNPVFAEIDKQLSLSANRTMRRVFAPLAGDEFFVTEKLLKRYAEAAESFFNEIAAHFKQHAEEYY